jgi:hypothetical protein
MMADIVELGASLVKKGVALWQGTTKVSEDDGDVEPLGEGDVFQGLGLTSMPFPADAKGKAEGVCLRGVAGRDTTFVGARDTRSAPIVGNAKPGDTIIHSTGPQQAAQVQCKEEKRQVIAATKDKNGKGMAVLLDGGSGKVQITIPGMFFEMNSNDGSFIISNGKASIIMQGEAIALDGKVILGGLNPNPAMKIMVSPAVAPVVVPVATTAAGVPAGAAKSVFVAK